MIEKRIIDKMVEAMELKESDIVLLNFWGTEEELGDLAAFESVFAEHKIVSRSLKLTETDILKLVEEYPNGLPEEWFLPIQDATVVVDMIASPIGIPPKALAQEKYPVFGAILGGLFEFMSQHEKMIQITMPSKENAKMADMPFEEYKTRVTHALDIDYAQLKLSCEQKIKDFKGNTRVIRTGENCVLTMSTEGRKWYIDAGDGAFPCGEIYIAPVENRTNGTIFFENFAVESVGVFKNVILTIDSGRVLTSNCVEFNDFIQQVKEKEEGADIVAELGIGMNPNVIGNEGDSSIDENAMGTFHIALGMNAMFGGENNCRFHMDFVTKGEIE